MSSERINGLWVEDSGTGGEAVLCIHGLGGSSNFWSPVMEAFGDKRVIRPDLAGAGRSGDPPGAISIASHVAALAGVLDALQIARAHVVAHSMGTIIAQHLAVAHPERVSSLALFGPLAAPPDAAREPTRNRARAARGGAAAMQEIADAICKAATSAQTKNERPVSLALVRESIMRQPPEGYALNCEALAEAQAAPVEQLAMPVLLVTGDEDGVGTPAGTQALAGRLKDARPFVLQGCGHWTTYEKPFECARLLADFYKR
ncbi:alpha/beta fold hydrolase [Bordetella hinzii]|uniref:Alpha/beta hydrolase n=4 Tax=Bordetella hinzii TaxID=103855 RepID=A0AAN1VG29_9BORD|nr:alpha/beta hydrolase [Bordetella hinzii]AKQ57005.1 2-hydroxymuconate semialdehyde hydrolase [Bordetella hinzii]AKQ61471.1 2-hydroxymuconate semialdehyde hydrolase [Bordetella hinzii]AZW17561.1 alpha/beta hydrolase [Bordetella hinzii]KCB23879.1 alpha/beta hydrolase family protein [Bordetella hinzii OH87 BAL007II]KCB32806.1 alpha/beta hydrolase family protein [Bordetella hinzii L60]